MPILVKGDDVRSVTKAKARHGLHRSQCVNWADVSVTLLKSNFEEII